MHAAGPEATTASRPGWARFGLGLALVLAGACSDDPREDARRVPKAVEAAPAPQAAASAQPEGEQLGDMRMVRLPVAGLDALSLREQTLLYHFQQALLSGRDIAYAQGSPHNLAVRRTLETVLETYRESRATPEFEDLKAYAGRFFFSGGLHHPISGEKLVPELDAAELAELVQHSDPRKLPLGSGQSVASWLEQLTPIVFSPAVEPRAAPATRQAAASSSRRALSQVAQWLERALPFAEGTQREALGALVQYLQTGDPEAFERYRALWRSEREARVDLALGFVADSDDPRGTGGVFAGVASFAVEPPPRMHTLLEHAGALSKALPLREGTFEPIDSPPAVYSMQAVVGGGAWATRLPSSLQLVPERPGHGRSLRMGNVVDATLPSVPQARVAALTLGAREQRRAREHGEAARRLYADLRSTLGQAAAPVPPQAPEPLAALGPYARTLLAARADLIALYIAFDPQLIELGAMPSFEVSRALYDAYVREALLASLAAIDDQAPPVDPRVRAARLVVQWARAQDPPQSPAVQRVLKEGDTYFVIDDYRALRRRFGQLLAEVQRVLAEGDRSAAATLVKDHADPLEPALRTQVVRRLAAASAQPATHVLGVLTPRLVADLEHETIQDVRLRYAGDALTQALADSRRYALLPAVSE